MPASLSGASLRRLVFAFITLSAFVGTVVVSETAAQAPQRDPDNPSKTLVECGRSPNPQELPPKSINDGLPNIVGTCNVILGQNYYYGQVNILQGGKLLFHENRSRGQAGTHFYSSSIIIENGGELSAGLYTVKDQIFPIGQWGGRLYIHLYGPAPEGLYGPKPHEVHAVGSVCKTLENDKTGPCGIPKKLWVARTRNVWSSSSKT